MGVLLWCFLWYLFLAWTDGCQAALNQAHHEGQEQHQIVQVAIIGAGPAGAASAYFLSQAQDERIAYNITIFESFFDVGGRVTTVRRWSSKNDSDLVELGIPDFPASDGILNSTITELNLTRLRVDADAISPVFFWDGKGVLETSPSTRFPEPACLRPFSPSPWYRESLQLEIGQADLGDDATGNRHKTSTLSILDSNSRFILAEGNIALVERLIERSGAHLYPTHHVQTVVRTTNDNNYTLTGYWFPGTVPGSRSFSSSFDAVIVATHDGKLQFTNTPELYRQEHLPTTVTIFESPQTLDPTAFNLFNIPRGKPFSIVKVPPLDCNEESSLPNLLGIETQLVPASTEHSRQSFYHYRVLTTDSGKRFGLPRFRSMLNSTAPWEVELVLAHTRKFIHASPWPCVPGQAGRRDISVDDGLYITTPLERPNRDVGGAIGAGKAVAEKLDLDLRRKLARTRGEEGET